MRRLKRIPGKVLVSIAASVVVLAIYGGGVKADTNTRIDSSGPQANSGTAGGSDFTPVTGVGTGSFNGQYSWYKIYVPNDQSTTITANQICADVGSPDVSYKVFSLDSNEKYDSLSGDFGNIYEPPWKSGGSCSNDISWSIGASAGIPSSIAGHKGYRVFAILAKIAPSPGDNERYFKVTSSNSSVKIGLAAPDFTSVWDLKYSTAYKPSPGTWDYEVMVAPRCGDSINNPVKIQIYDPDNGIYQSNMHAYVESSPRGSLNWSTQKDWTAQDVQGGSDKWGQSGTTSTLSFYADNNHIYKFHVVGAAYPNTIQIKVPFDQFDASLSSCDQDPDGDIYSLQCNYIKVWGQDDNDPSRTLPYQVLRNGSVIASGTADNNADPNHPGHSDRNDIDLSDYLNTGYTYQLQVRNVRPDGSLGGWFDAGPAKSVSRLCGKTACNYLTVTDPGTETPPDGTVERDTNTFVSVTDSRGKKLVDDAVSWAPDKGLHGGHLGKSETGTWNYLPTGSQVNIKIIRKYKTLDGTDFIAKTRVVRDDTVTCYAPTCALTVWGDGPGGIVVKSGTIHVSATISEPPRGGSSPDLIDIPESPDGNSRLSITTDGPTAHFVPDEVGTGSSVTFTWNTGAMGSRGVQTIHAYPDFYGIGGIGASCDKAVDVYEHFTITPTAKLVSTNWENPSTINYQGCGRNIEGPSIGASAASSVTGPTSNTAPTASHTYDPGADVCDTYSFSPSSISAGDQYCPHVTITYAKGYVGPAGNIVAGEPGTDDGDCQNVHNEPYVHFFGADVIAGGNFGTGTCNNPGGIKTYLSTTGFNNGGSSPPVGSGVQIGALSIGPAQGFSSAILRGADPKGANGLMFSNTNPSSPSDGGPGAPTVGGNLNGSHCVPDYYSTLPAGTPTDSGSFTIPSTSNGKQIKNYGSDTTIIGGDLPNGNNIVIYVHGDVIITGGRIKFANTSWGDIKDIPSFMLIVKGGNIYIDKSVTQLEGTYVAQPEGGTGGSIYTCANGTSAYSAASLLSNCRAQLVVNGSFVAQRVYLDRSFGSLRNSYPGEHLSGTAQSCTDSGSTNLGDCAAEIFNLTPDLYLGNSGLPPDTGPTTGKYDFMTSLSPVL